jgi:cytochrome c oxidase subunit 2
LRASTTTHINSLAQAKIAQKDEKGYLMLRWLPENVATFGGDVDDIFWLIYVIVGVWFVLTYSVIIYALFRYRHSRQPRAVYIQGNTPAQYGWLLALGLVVLVLDIGIDERSAEVWERIKSSPPAADVQMRVTAKRFNWEVRYTGPDGHFDTADDLQIDGELHVPVNKVVQVVLGSKDVIHSFFLPHLRLKQDAMPGRTIPVWFQATKPGVYPLPCAELCGFGHTGMLGNLTVHTPEDYAVWVKKRWPAS